MKKRLIIIFVFIWNFGQSHKKISLESQKVIIEKLSNEINKFYFNKGISKSIGDTLSIIKKQIKGDNDIDNFTKILNSALHKKSDDNHLKLYFDINKFKSYSEDKESKRTFEYESAKKINFGFTKIEILEGNIGYIEIIRFSGFIGEEVAQKIASSMNMIESTNALIIDLRKNGGGDGRVGEILSTYFYSEENEIYYDSISKTEKFKVLPFVLGKRYLNRPVYILTGLGTFSAAEGFTKFMQKNKKAIVVGEKTKGGGSPGSTLPLLDGFLCFIPTSFGESDEYASVKPNFITSEKNALNYAKYLFYKGELSKNLNENDKEILQWNIETSEYLLKENNKKFTVNENFIGNYESNRKIFSKNEQLYFSLNNSDYKLIQIGEKEFIIEGFENTFRPGNRRIIFKEKGFDEAIYFSGQLLHKFWDKL